MRIHLLALVGLAISFALPAFAQEQNTVDPEVRQQIEAVIKEYSDAYNKFDAAATADFFTAEAVEVFAWESGDGAASGRQAIEKRYAVKFASNPVQKLSHKLVQLFPIGNDMCAITEFSHQTGTRGYAVRIYVREGDDWKIRTEYAN